MKKIGTVYERARDILDRAARAGIGRRDAMVFLSVQLPRRVLEQLESEAEEAGMTAQDLASLYMWESLSARRRNRDSEGPSAELGRHPEARQDD